jgi:hypothetical protein
MKLLGGKWSRGDLLALLGVLAALLAIPGMPKLFRSFTGIPTLWYAEIQSGWRKRRRSRAFRSIRSFRDGYVRWAGFRFFRDRFAGTIRSACFDFELLFSRDLLLFQNCSATCSGW